MSYDLYFYKQTGTEVSKDRISKYLSDNLFKPNEGNNRWFYENKDTEVYFSFAYHEAHQDYRSHEGGYENTHFSFNLNYMRPTFFGLEAFQFIEKFCQNLNLYVTNPQSDSQASYRPTQQEQFETWNRTNLWTSKDHFNERQHCYLDEDYCVKVWEYNANRKALQQKLGEGYFVPKIFFFKTRKTNEPFTITAWTDHIPTVMPETDYVLLNRMHEELVSTIKDKVLVSRATFLKVFGDSFDNFDLPNCKIIHADSAERAKDKFNSIASENKLNEFAVRLEMQNLFNARPE